MNNVPPPTPPPIPRMGPLPRDQRNIDTDHLNLLSIFHFIGAGLAFLAMLLLLAEFAFMHFALANPEFWQNQRQPAPPPGFFEMFRAIIWFYLVVALWCLASVILNILSGLYLRARKNRTFSFVVACINCLHIPFGTILGVFTIIVLARESVRELYEEAK
ncbi:MAG TPA: hypothetical protein VMF08_20565 [Candidatus Sulfotelmatobacter sp.]|nr:hypothetical protein [Candidatus Sulfotelmatobacter sp.]